MRAILCVDDEEMVLSALYNELSKHFKEYTIELAESAEDGLEILDELYEDGISVVVIISDWMMPGMKGDEFLIEAHKRFPTVVKIMLTGQAEPEAIDNARKHADLTAAVYKPWKSGELITLIQKEVENVNR